MEQADVERIAHAALEMMGCGHYVVDVSHMKIVITNPETKEQTMFMYSTNDLDRYTLIGAVVDTAHKIRSTTPEPDAGDGDDENGGE